MANHRYYITRPNGEVDDIGADDCLFENHHLIFIDEDKRPVVVLHADEVREIGFEWDEGALAH